MSNLFIDLFISVFTVTVLKKKVGFSRIFISAAIGGICAALYPIVGRLKFFLKAFCGILMSAMITPKGRFKDYWMSLFVFDSVTFVLGGTVSFLIGFTELEYADFTYGILPITLSVSCVCIIFLYDGIRKEYEKIRHKNECFYKTTLKIDNIEKAYSAFYDSGNRVYSKNGEPVIFVSEKIYNRMDGDAGSVEILTAAGVKFVRTKRADLKIYFEDGTNILYKAVAGKLTAPCEAEIILHSDMQGR